MRLRVDTAFGMGALLAVQLVTSFAAVGLLARTSPAIERILVEDRSIAAVERALAVLASDGDRATFDAAVAEARRLANDPAEQPLFERISANEGPALAGDARARTELAATLTELAAVHRASKEEFDEQARFVGRAGAWATALLGGFGFLLSVVVYRRLRARVEEPILGIDATLRALRSGEMRRRASTREGSVEARRIAENVNWLVDRLEQERHPVPEEDRTDRALLVAVLDREEGAVIALDLQGRPIAVNKRALALWDEEGDPTAELALAVRTEDGAVAGWSLERVEAAKAVLCRRTGG